MTSQSRAGGGRAGVVDRAGRVTLDESVNMAFLVVLEEMTPAERVAFILHDVFRNSFAEVARIVGRSPAACRQLAPSARRRIRTAQALPAPAGRQAGVVRAFKAGVRVRRDRRPDQAHLGRPQPGEAPALKQHKGPPG